MMHRLLASSCILFLLAPPSFAVAASYGAPKGILRERVVNRHLRGKTRGAMVSVSRKFTRPDEVARSMKTYKNEMYGVALGYPSSWKIIENYMNTVVSFVSPLADPRDTLTENVNILVEDAKGSLAESTKNALEELQNLERFKLVSSEDVILDKLPGKAVSYTAGTSPPLKFKQIWTVRNGKLIIFTFASASDAFREYVRIFDKMVFTVMFQ